MAFTRTGLVSSDYCTTDDVLLFEYFNVIAEHYIFNSILSLQLGDYSWQKTLGTLPSRKSTKLQFRLCIEALDGVHLSIIRELDSS